MLTMIEFVRSSMRALLRVRPVRSEAGASLVEYALLLALVAVVAIGALVFLGGTTSNTLQNVANNVANP